MLVGIDEKGNLKNVKVTEDGKLLVESGDGGNSTIGNTDDNPVPVKVISGVEAIPVSGNVAINNTNAIPINGNVTINNSETTLYAGVMTVGTEAQTIGVSQKVTQISVANYSDTSDISIDVDGTSYIIGANIAIDLPINKVVGTIGLSATEVDTKVQYVVKGGN